MPLAVSNSTPLIHLSKLGLLHLLAEQFEQVIVPPAVWREVVDDGSGRAGASELRRALGDGWLSVRSPSRGDVFALVRCDLDDGESEAISVASELEGCVVLLDEADARRTAARLGLKRTGTLGVLLAARLRGSIDRLAPVLAELRATGSFWVADHLVQQVLEAAGEGAGDAVIG